MQARLMPAMILVLGGLLVAVVLINVAIGARPDYADLVPSPESVLWEQGDETTVWLSTNLDDVDLRIGAVDLGFGAFSQIEEGQKLELGRGEGCLAWAVSELETYSIVDSTTPAGKRLSIQGELSRGTNVDEVYVYVRIYPMGADLDDLDDYTNSVLTNAGSTGAIFAFTVAAGGTVFTNRQYEVEATTGLWVVEASHSLRFPATSRVVAQGDVSDIETWAAMTAEAVDVVLPDGVGVGLIACSEADDVLVTLHSDGVELRRYRVDIHPDEPVPTPIPQPAGVVPYDVRVCVDSADHRANYLDGWEYVGDALNAGAFDDDANANANAKVLSAVITDTSEMNEYRYFFAPEIVAGAVQLRVTPAGASATSGLDADRIYPLTITADIESGGNKIEREITRGVWLDTSTLSPTANGRCA